MNDTVFTARRAVVLNPGTEPVIPPIPGLADTPYWTNREAVAATEAPESLVVIGGGTVGLELAQAFARFGSQVIVLEAAGRLLSEEEPEAGELLAQVLREEGLGVRLAAEVRTVDHSGDAFTVELADGPVRAHRLLVATGRRTDLKALGVDAVGCDTGARFLEPDERMRIADGVHKAGNRGSISWSTTSTAVFSSAPPPPDRPAVRCSPPLPSPCTPGCPSTHLGR